MKIVILCAGRGTRLRPITDEIPKVLVEIQGEPMLKWIIEECLLISPEEIIIIHGYRGDQVIDFCRKYEHQVPFRFIKQETLDGTAGAVKCALPHINTEFSVIFGGSVYRADTINRFYASEYSNLIATVSVPDPHRFGVVAFDSDRNITLLQEKPEKPASNDIVAGLYKFEKEAAPFFFKIGKSERGEYEIPTVVNMMIKAGFNFKSFDVGFMADAGTHEEIKKLNSMRDLFSN